VGFQHEHHAFSSCLQRGAFPIYPSKESLIFVPLSFELPLSLQLQEVDMVLHKITDEIVKIDPNCSINFPKGISFSAGMFEIIRYKALTNLDMKGVISWMCM
jgi:hypothetical protein